MPKNLKAFQNIVRFEVLAMLTEYYCLLGCDAMRSGRCLRFEGTGAYSLLVKVSDKRDFYPEDGNTVQAARTYVELCDLSFLLCCL